MRHRRIGGPFFKTAMLAALLALPLSGCMTRSAGGDQPTRDSRAVNLIYYTIGNPDPDLKRVNEKINEVTSKKIGVTITYIKVGWQEYNDRLHTLISTGSPFDIAFATDYAGFVQRGAWLKLDEALAGPGREMYEAIDPVLWEGVRMEDGGIYGVPTNKELAVRMQWMYPESLVRKYGIDIAKYGTLESLAPLLEMISDKEPDYQPMELDKDSQNFFALDGYEYVTDKPLPLMVRSLDPKAPVVGIFETEEARRVLDTLRAYYLKGYINEDAALREGQNLKRGERVFWKPAGGAVRWLRTAGARIAATRLSPIPCRRP